jgi:RimJ/RimL family protein N-acetyltransferase
MHGVLADRSLYRFTGGEPPDLDDLRRRYRAQVSGPPGGPETWSNWIVRVTADDRAIGFVQATVVGTAADVAWLIGSAHQGRGLATEAAGAMCDWLARQGVRRLTAHIHTDHVASQHVAARLGLIDSGALDDDDEQIWVTGSIGAVRDPGRRR